MNVAITTWSQHADGAFWRLCGGVLGALEGGHGVSPLFPLNVQNWRGEAAIWRSTEHTEKRKMFFFYIGIVDYRLNPPKKCSFPLNSFHVLISSYAGPLGFFSVPADSSGPSSTVSSAGPSSPTTADTSPRFSFSDKISLTPQSSEETHSSQNISSQPLTSIGSQVLDPTCPTILNPGEVPLTPNNSPEDDAEPCAVTGLQSDDPECSQEGLEMSPAVSDAIGVAVSDPGLRPPCSALAELSLSRMEGYCLPGSLPVLLELRESSSEAGSSSQTPQSPEGPDEFFDTQESVDLWMDSPENLPRPETPLEVGATHTAEP